MSLRAVFSVATITLLASLSGCATDPPAPPANEPTAAASPKGLPDRDPALAHKLVKEGAVLLDVRTPAEYAEHHLEGATNIAVQELPTRLGEVEKLTAGDKKKPIVLYCGSGKRAATAKTQLLEAGYENVTNAGGIADMER